MFSEKIMAKELSIRVDGVPIIPEQTLENTIGFVSVVTYVHVEKNKTVRIAIRNKTDAQNGQGVLCLNEEDFLKLSTAYNLRRPYSLVSKPIIAVYSREHGEMLSGFIPVNLK
jgi:hypothetical protein